MLMNKKIFTLSIFAMLFAFVMNGKAEEKIINANGGEVTIMGQVQKVPEYTKWLYFSFEKGEIVGESAFTLKDTTATKVGTEVPDAEWAARKDWDIAFHATDIRTNGLTAVRMADTTSTTPLDQVYANLTEAPEEGYEADAILEGTFIGSMSEGMPPPRAAQMSGCKATQGWANFGMTGGGNAMNQMVVVFKLNDDKYVKVYLKEFENEEGDPGYIKMEYAELSTDPSSNADIENTQISVYPNPATDVVNVMLPDAGNNTPIIIYNISGAVVKQVNGQAGVNTIAVSDLSAGMYIVKANKLTQKLIVK